MKINKSSGSIFALGSNPYDRHAEHTYNEDRHAYVPHMLVADLQCPNMSNLISMPRRFYLHPIDEDYHQKKMDAHDKHVESLDLYVAEKAPVLDLGTANLQRIVNNMKGITFDDGGAKVYKYSKDTARLNGLKSFTKYSGCPHAMHPWKGKHSIYKEEEKPDRNSSMYVGTGCTHSGRQL